MAQSLSAPTFLSQQTAPSQASSTWRSPAGDGATLTAWGGLSALADYIPSEGRLLDVKTLGPHRLGSTGRAPSACQR